MTSQNPTKPSSSHHNPSESNEMTRQCLFKIDDQIKSQRPFFTTDESETQMLLSESRRLCDDGEKSEILQSLEAPPSPVKAMKEIMEEENGRERLKRHQLEVAGRVWIPDIWGQEELLKDWIDCSAFDASLVPNGIMSARAALAEEGRRSNSSELRIENRC